LLVLLPVLTLGACVAGLMARLHCWRTAVLSAAVIWGVLLVAITEVLSAFHRVGAFDVAACWLAAFVVGAIFVVGSPQRFRIQWPPGLILAPPLFLGLLGLLVVLVLTLAAVAILSPPNTWDSMTYHMARLIHWMQDASLAPYPTHILRQLYLQPGAEFILLHLQLLSGGDHLAGLVQWAAMVGALFGTSLIARDLGAGQLGQLVACILAASVPIGVLESTSTQNDYVVAFWLVCSAAFGLRVTRASSSGAQWATTGALGASIGLALLTKATAYLYVLPVLVWVAASLVRTRGWRAVGQLAVVAVLALVLNAGFYVRNLQVFGSPSGPLDEGLPNDAYLNAALTPPLMASNVVRDLGLNLVATPLAPLNNASAAVVREIHSWLGVDSDDPRTTWGTESFVARAGGLGFDENFASNPVHLVLLLAALVAIPLLRRRLPRECLDYAFVLSGGFLLFSAVLRWQPWHTRLELPLFVLGAPLVATVIDRAAPRLLGAVAVVMLVSMLPWVAYNQARPLIGPRSILSVRRDDQYFTNRPSLRSAYLGSVAFVAGHACDRVGFVSTGDGWEYPLWAVLTESARGPVTIEQVAVANLSAAWPAPVAGAGFQPCAVVSIDQDSSAGSLELGGDTYRPAWTMGQVTVSTPGGS
jgi:hypothetical protein